MNMPCPLSLTLPRKGGGKERGRQNALMRAESERIGGTPHSNATGGGKQWEATKPSDAGEEGKIGGQWLKLIVMEPIKKMTQEDG